ncbi:DUF504 domain-containing protein [Aspergillus clavatus NRRL 1]|uniref:MJ1316 RNA cyclic group end recognition domain-containing protein n=1 Tax=Aspergillus clavatus (strain ATCC 1007 / CBS 513.65 / DSM 816 / NCTC 3887 / NRRL 1 / QM 1276 / 107) TaxID=344612 RepID=A1CNH5_ASPCL|nr:uncharacterized protein ACLA_019010 [Aspergillus clavatus NRRL 1]EAW07196.1 conserved hypothetical protein [Aspergillus clavatus NRRL 1]
MAPELFPASEDHTHGNEPTTSVQDQNHGLSTSLPPVSPQPDAEECLVTDEEPFQSTSTSKRPASAENRLRPAADVINRLIWDTQFESNNYLIGYEDRFNGRLEANLSSWKKDLTDEEFIPQHRILYIKRKSDDDIVWDKRRRIDKIFLSGNSAFDYLAFLA